MILWLQFDSNNLKRPLLGCSDNAITCPLNQIEGITISFHIKHSNQRRVEDVSCANDLHFVLIMHDHMQKAEIQCTSYLFHKAQNEKLVQKANLLLCPIEIGFQASKRMDRSALLRIGHVPYFICCPEEASFNFLYFKIVEEIAWKKNAKFSWP